MMKTLILFLSFFSLSLFSFGQQKQAAWWFFGDSLSINFNNQPIVADTGQSPPLYSVIYSADATISDANGNLLFYSNGFDIMNRNRKVMPNGNLYPTNQIIRSRANLIVEKPGSKSQYFFFSIFGYYYGGLFDLTYNLIDLTLDGGRGDVVSGQKSQIIRYGSGEYLAILQHSNKIDYWLVTSTKDADTLVSYPITSSGIGQPVFSPLTFKLNYFGKLKSSPDSQWLAATNYQGVELFRFNQGNGVVTHNGSLVTGAYQPTTGVRSVAFSTNSKVLYAGESSHNRLFGQPLASNLFQFNLAVGNITAIQSTRQLIDSLETSNIWDIQLGIDGKLYVLQTHTKIGSDPPRNWLSIIHCPNLPGTACRLQKQGVNLYGKFGGNQLPSLNQTLFRNSDKLQALAMRDTICPGDSVQLSAFGAAADRFRWFPSSAADTIASPYVKPLQTITYTVIGFSACRQDTARVTVTVLPVTESPCWKEEYQLEFYNIITPNHDGLNDAFVIKNLQLYPNSRLQIFNRWGSEIYSSDDYQNNWQAEEQSSGIYYYRLNISNGSNYTGWVEVVK